MNDGISKRNGGLGAKNSFPCPMPKTRVRNRRGGFQLQPSELRNDF